MPASMNWNQLESILDRYSLAVKNVYFGTGTSLYDVIDV